MIYWVVWCEVDGNSWVSMEESKNIAGGPDSIRVEPYGIEDIRKILNASSLIGVKAFDSIFTLRENAVVYAKLAHDKNPSAKLIIL